MSNVSNRHSVAPFIAGTSKALNEQRLARVGFKLTEKMKKAGQKALPSVCASVPMIDPAAIEVHWENLVPYVQTLLETAQDGIFRSLYVSSAGTLSSIADEELSIPACIAFMEAQRADLSAETVGTWFDSELTDALTVIVADKLGFTLETPEQESTVAKHVRIHRDVLCMIAGRSVILQPKQAAGIRNMLKIAPEDAMNARITAKMNELERKTVEDLEMIDIG